MFSLVLRAFGPNQVSANPAAAQNLFAGIKYSGLAGSDGALRLAKRNSRGGGVERSDFCVCRLVAIADADFRIYCAVRDSVRNPVYVADLARCAAKLAIIADNQAVFRAIE